MPPPRLPPFDERLRNVRALGEAWSEPSFARQLVDAYVSDTAARTVDARQREVRTPSVLCGLDMLAARAGQDDRTDAKPDAKPNDRPYGRVAVAVPRNSVGLTIAKAVVGAYLAGNEVLMRLPEQLTRTRPLVESLLRAHLQGVTLAPEGLNGRAFLQASFEDPSIDAVVIYGDDAWIDRYFPLAERTRTRMYFEGPGKDPLIVLPGADLAVAVDAAIRGGLHNGGQSCSAFERFFVHRSLHDPFVALLEERLRALRIGRPDDAETDVGPIASRVVMSRLVQQLEEAQQAGAVLRLGGAVIPDVHDGLPAMAPALLTHVTPQMTIMADESFGPVFPVMPFDDDGDLLPAVDDNRYGLNAAVFGPGAERYVPWLEARHRNTYVDATPFDVASLPTRIWDGGYRRSGFCWLPEGDRMVVREGRRLLAQVLVPQG